MEQGADISRASRTSGKPMVHSVPRDHESRARNSRNSSCPPSCRELNQVKYGFKVLVVLPWRDYCESEMGGGGSEGHNGNHEPPHYFSQTLLSIRAGEQDSPQEFTDDFWLTPPERHRLFNGGGDEIQGPRDWPMKNWRCFRKAIGMRFAFAMAGTLAVARGSR